jgi:serine/threonine protein kinase
MNTTTNQHDNLFGNIPYVAPEIIKADNESKSDPYTKSSDVYSLGVVFWQISSGKTPFKGQNKNKLLFTVMSGIREKRIPGTPDEYYNLYNQCRNDELERHTIENAYDVLEKLLKKVTKRWIWILNKFNRIFSME